MNGHRFSFGQYKGDLIIDHINFEEIDYIRWCIVNVPLQMKNLINIIK